MESNDPKCPKCDARMLKRLARHGPHRGNEFWGCSRYPKCKGIVSIDAPSTKPNLGASDALEKPPDLLYAERARHPRKVNWSDGSTDRTQWQARYSNCGGSLRSVPVADHLLGKRLTSCWVARKRVGSAQAADESVIRTVAMAHKILQRGSLPPLHPESERTLLTLCGFADSVSTPGTDIDLAPQLNSPVDRDNTSAIQWFAEDFQLDRSLRFDSREELRFLANWVPRVLGASAGRWITTQAPLDALLNGLGFEGAGARRVDFLFHAPQVPTFVVEIDGDQHGDQVLVDKDRDTALAEAGIEVIRIPTSELSSGEGPGFDRIKAIWKTPELPNNPDINVLRLRYGATHVHRLVLAILEGVAAGFLTGKSWAIEIVDPLAISVPLLRPYLDLISAIAELWGPTLAPHEVHILSDGKWTDFLLDEGRYAELDGDRVPLDLVIRLETNRSPMDLLEANWIDIPEVVVRSARLPVDIVDPVGDINERSPIRTGQEATPVALKTILQAVFAKRDFRPGQIEAVTEVLEGRDCAVLLPTGAGKSLIYQLAGLCLPGRTLVIDPIVALIEDQIEGLKRQGIDRTTGISSHEIKLGRSEAILQEVASGDALFIFIAPERLQQQSFRSALRELASTTPINLAVVDESHCVSEWGHDFRTSYLNLGRVIRQTCRDRFGGAPPILALTGTASRAVLRDVLIELGIEPQTPNTIIRPPSFDRPELRFEVIKTTPAESTASLAGYLRALPMRFGVPHAEFFRSRRDLTYSGLVFCPHVNGAYGVRDVSEKLQNVIGARPPIYAGGAPKVFPGNWEQEKRFAARAFKENQSPVLVSTKAFGMGIDKPNIRYVVHYGIPTSIEAYYQEVGRAGRDGQPARCGLILSEYSEDRAHRLLDDDVDIETTREAAAQITSSSADDISRALFFHLNSFKGRSTELISVGEIVDEIGPLDVAMTTYLPMGDSDSAKQAREKAIHRLVLLGVVSDYLVDWGGRRFEVHLNGTSNSSVVESLLAFIERSQPGKAATIESSIHLEEWQKPREAVVGCAEVLIAFVYDTIERSRRRCLREMWLAARESDSDEALRSRILDYLSEGDLSPRLVKLAEAPSLDFGQWISLYREILSQADAREWRGATGRLLASYPDHPGLLVGRALSELLDDQGEVKEFYSNLQQACLSSQRYGIEAKDMSHLLEWILDKASPLGAAGVAMTAWTQDDLTTGEWALLEARFAGTDPVAAVSSLGRRLKELDHDLEKVVSDAEWRHA